MAVIREVCSAADLAQIRQLMREYADGLGVSLDYENFEAELQDLPGVYAPPQGRLLLAWQQSEALGCVGLRPFAPGICEMKRLYVRSQARGKDLGRQLAERVCAEGRAAGYRQIYLDTLPTMLPAQQLYRALGFKPIAAYRYNPVPHTQYFALQL
ncbi:MAG: GNAT family N-acetyltransferase [Sinobacteraceae bacterium]|nr:GNAT family N-acetyltransferase [Nevskiaceae bacterium]